MASVFSSAPSYALPPIFSGVNSCSFHARPPGSISVQSSPSLSLPKRRRVHFAAGGATVNSVPARNGVVYTVGDFMTRKEDLHVVKTWTPVDEAWEALVQKGVTGFPVVDEDWNLVGVVSDYDLLALDSISGTSESQTSVFPDVNSSWRRFNEIQKLVSKSDGKVVGDLMSPAPLVVREMTNLEDAARLLLETKFRRLPVVDGNGKLVGIITRGNVVRAALEIKRLGFKNFKFKMLASNEFHHSKLRMPSHYSKLVM